VSDDLLRPQGDGIPLPQPGRLSAPYWEACARGELVYMRCRDCATAPRRPSPVCPACGHGDLAWEPSSGRGRLYSWTVVWRPQHPAFRTPYAPAVVGLEEGWWLMTSVIGCRPDELRDGMDVSIEFHPAGGGFHLPYAVAR
jgi:uncharacterized OB-fold protein